MTLQVVFIGLAEMSLWCVDTIKHKYNRTLAPIKIVMDAKKQVFCT